MIRDSNSTEGNTGCHYKYLDKFILIFKKREEQERVYRPSILCSSYYTGIHLVELRKNTQNCHNSWMYIDLKGTSKEP